MLNNVGFCCNIHQHKTLCKYCIKVLVNFKIQAVTYCYDDEQPSELPAKMTNFVISVTTDAKQAIGCPPQAASIAHELVCRTTKLSALLPPALPARLPIITMHVTFRPSQYSLAMGLANAQAHHHESVHNRHTN